MRPRAPRRALLRSGAVPDLPAVAPLIRCRGLRLLSALRRRQALLQRLHEVDDLAPGLLGGRLGDDLLALGLALEQRQHLLAIVVLVFADVELRRQGLDQLLGHLQLALARLGVRVGQAFELVLGDDFIGVQHGGDRQRLPQRPDRREVLLGAQNEATDADLVGPLHGFAEERVGLRGAAIRHQVVRARVVDGIDLGQLDEVLDLDRLGRLGIERLELLAGDGDVASLADLESLDDVLPGDFLAVDAADALLLDAPAILVVQHVEAHLLRGGGGEQLHRHTDQSEADRTAPDGPGHR